MQAFIIRHAETSFALATHGLGQLVLANCGEKVSPPVWVFDSDGYLRTATEGHVVAESRRHERRGTLAVMDAQDASAGSTDSSHCAICGAKLSPLGLGLIAGAKAAKCTGCERWVCTQCVRGRGVGASTVSSADNASAKTLCMQCCEHGQASSAHFHGAGKGGGGGREGRGAAARMVPIKWRFLTPDAAKQFPPGRHQEGGNRDDSGCGAPVVVEPGALAFVSAERVGLFDVDTGRALMPSPGTGLASPCPLQLDWTLCAGDGDDGGSASPGAFVFSVVKEVSVVSVPWDHANRSVTAGITAADKDAEGCKREEGPCPAGASARTMRQLGPQGDEERTRCAAGAVARGDSASAGRAANEVSVAHDAVAQEVKGEGAGAGCATNPMAVRSCTTVTARHKYLLPCLAAMIAETKDARASIARAHALVSNLEIETIWAFRDAVRAAVVLEPCTPRLNPMEEGAEEASAVHRHTATIGIWAHPSIEESAIVALGVLPHDLCSVSAPWRLATLAMAHKVASLVTSGRVGRVILSGMGGGGIVALATCQQLRHMSVPVEVETIAFGAPVLAYGGSCDESHSSALESQHEIVLLASDVVPVAVVAKAATRLALCERLRPSRFGHLDRRLEREEQRRIAAVTSEVREAVQPGALCALLRSVPGILLDEIPGTSAADGLVPSHDAHRRASSGQATLERVASAVSERMAITSRELQSFLHGRTPFGILPPPLAQAVWPPCQVSLITSATGRVVGSAARGDWQGMCDLLSVVGQHCDCPGPLYHDPVSRRWSTVADAHSARSYEAAVLRVAQVWPSAAPRVAEAFAVPMATDARLGPRLSFTLFGTGLSLVDTLLFVVPCTGVREAAAVHLHGDTLLEASIPAPFGQVDPEAGVTIVIDGQGFEPMRIACRLKPPPFFDSDVHEATGMLWGAAGVPVDADMPHFKLFTLVKHLSETSVIGNSGRRVGLPRLWRNLSSVDGDVLEWAETGHLLESLVACCAFIDSSCSSVAKEALRLASLRRNAVTHQTPADDYGATASIVDAPQGRPATAARSEYCAAQDCYRQLVDVDGVAPDVAVVECFAPLWNRVAATLKRPLTLSHARQPNHKLALDIIKFAALGATLVAGTIVFAPGAITAGAVMGTLGLASASSAQANLRPILVFGDSYSDKVLALCTIFGVNVDLQRADILCLETALAGKVRSMLARVGGSRAEQMRCTGSANAFERAVWDSFDVTVAQHPFIVGLDDFDKQVILHSAWAVCTIRELRLALRSCIVIGATGTINAGKGTTLSALFRAPVVRGERRSDSTTAVGLVRYPGLPVMLLDFPGIGDAAIRAGHVPDAMHDLLSVGLVVIQWEARNTGTALRAIARAFATQRRRARYEPLVLMNKMDNSSLTIGEAVNELIAFVEEANGRLLALRRFLPFVKCVKVAAASRSPATHDIDERLCRSVARVIINRRVAASAAADLAHVLSNGDHVGGSDGSHRSGPQPAGAGPASAPPVTAASPASPEDDLAGSLLGIDADDEIPGEADIALLLATQAFDWEDGWHWPVLIDLSFFLLTAMEPTQGNTAHVRGFGDSLAQVKATIKAVLHRLGLPPAHVTGLCDAGAWHASAATLLQACARRTVQGLSTIGALTRTAVQSGCRRGAHMMGLVLWLEQLAACLLGEMVDSPGTTYAGVWHANVFAWRLVDAVHTRIIQAYGGWAASNRNPARLLGGRGGTPLGDIIDDLEEALRASVACVDLDANAGGRDSTIVPLLLTVVPILEQIRNDSRPVALEEALRGARPATHVASGAGVDGAGVNAGTAGPDRAEVAPDIVVSASHSDINIEGMVCASECHRIESLLDTMRGLLVEAQARAGVPPLSTAVANDVGGAALCHNGGQ